MKKLIVIVIAAVLVGAGVWFGPAPKEISSDAPSAPDVGQQPLTRHYLVSAAPISVADAGSSQAGASASEIAAAYSAAYPRVGELFHDWREFYRNAESIAIAPHPDIPLEFDRVFVKDEGRTVVWYGTHKDIQGSSVVVVSGERGGKDVVLQLPGSSQFSIRTDADGRTSIQESHPGEEGCGAAPAQPDRSVSQSLAMPFADYIRNGFGRDLVPESTVASAAAIGAITADPATLKVDVLFLYDSATLAAASAQSADPAGYIEGQSRARIETANVVLAQSAVTNFQWRMVGVLPAPVEIPVSPTLSSYLTAMLSGTTGEWTAAQRYEYGADQVLFWKGSAPNDYAGMAYSLKQVPVSRGSALSVAMWGASYKTMMHELSHNFGCGHDRETASASDADGFYAYGQMFSTPAPHGGTFLASTIMGYGTYVVPYFSNPEIEIHVNAAAVEANTTADWGMRPLGVPAAEPRAAYNAKVLRDNAGAMAAMSDEITVPAFTLHPVGATVSAGNYLSLSASASGGGLKYQWLRNGTAITGAIGSSYSKAAVPEDEGTYTVRVTNRAGTATSNPAAVTVTASTAPPPSNSGGGGGGAPSVWFLAMIGGALVWRWTGCGCRR